MVGTQTAGYLGAMSVGIIHNTIPTLYEEIYGEGERDYASHTIAGPWQTCVIRRDKIIDLTTPLDYVTVSVFLKPEWGHLKQEVKPLLMKFFTPAVVYSDLIWVN